MRDIQGSGVLGEAEYNEEDDSDFDFEDELKRTNMRDDFTDKNLNFDKMVSKELRGLINRSGKKTTKAKKNKDDGGGDVVLPNDDLAFLKELEKDGRIESSEEESEDEETSAKEEKNSAAYKQCLQEQETDEETEEED